MGARKHKRPTIIWLSRNLSFFVEYSSDLSCARRVGGCLTVTKENSSVKRENAAQDMHGARLGGVGAQLCQCRGCTRPEEAGPIRPPGRSRCPWRRPQMVPRTPRSIVRDCTIERGSSPVLNRPNARSLQACPPSRLVHFFLFLTARKRTHVRSMPSL